MSRARGTVTLRPLPPENPVCVDAIEATRPHPQESMTFRDIETPGDQSHRGLRQPKARLGFVPGETGSPCVPVFEPFSAFGPRNWAPNPFTRKQLRFGIPTPPPKGNRWTITPSQDGVCRRDRDLKAVRMPSRMIESMRTMACLEPPQLQLSQARRDLREGQRATGRRASSTDPECQVLAYVWVAHPSPRLAGEKERSHGIL